MDLCGNKLEGKIPKSFGKLKSLKFIRLNNNELTGSILRELTHLTNLKISDVSNSDLCGTIPVDGNFGSFPMESTYVFSYPEDEQWTKLIRRKKMGLWKAFLNWLCRDVVSGLAHLQKRRIVHRDLKPQNVLIMIEDQSLCAKLSDMGMSKQLTVDKSAYSPTGCGSKGWQAPEVIDKQRQTRATDLFSLGCLIFFCVTGGTSIWKDY